MQKLFLKSLSIFAFLFVILILQFASAGVIPFAFWRKQGASFLATGAPVSQDAATEIVLPKPAGLNAGDLMYAFVQTFDIDTTATTATPSGWTLIGSAQHNSNMYIINVYRRVALAGESGNVTFSFTEAVTWSQGVIASYAPANVASPEDAAPVFSVGNNADPATFVNATGVTTVTTATRVLYMAFSARRASPSWGAPAGFTTRVNNIDTPNNQSMHLADRLYESPQATGTLFSTGWGDPANNRYLIVVLPIRAR